MRVRAALRTGLLSAFVLVASLLVGQPAAAQNCSGQNANLPLLTFTGQIAATVTSPDQTNCMSRGLALVIDLTTMTTANVTVTIQGKDIASGKYYTLLAGATVSSTGTTLLIVYPGSTAAANTDANYPLPRTWRVSVLVANNGGTAAVTGTIGGAVIN